MAVSSSALLSAKMLLKFKAATAVALLLLALSATAQVDPQPNQLPTPATSTFALLALVSAWHTSRDYNGDSAAVTLGWLPGTDPCLDNWTGIHCFCYGSDNSVSTLPCTGAAHPDVDRLQLAAPLRGAHPVLYGSLPDVFGGLAHLSLVAISNHRIYGIVPSSLLTSEGLINVALDGNLLFGEIVPSGVTNISSTLDSLDVRFNMLSGSLYEVLCGLSILQIDGNARLCGNLPDCLRGGAIPSALGTGLLGIGAQFRRCDSPVTRCLAPPVLSDVVAEAVPPEYSDTLCKLLLDRGVIGAWGEPLDVFFGDLVDADALVLSVTDHALVTFDAWFWLSPDVEQLLGYYPVRF